MKEGKKKFLLYTLGAAVIAIIYLIVKYMRLDKTNFVELFNFKTTLVLLAMVFIFALMVILFVSEEKYKDTKLSLIAIIIFAIIFAGISYYRFTQITGAQASEISSIKASLLKQLAFFAVYIFAFFGSFAMLKKNEEMTKSEDSKKTYKKKKKKK